MSDDIKAALELARETLASAACCNSIPLARALLAVGAGLCAAYRGGAWAGGVTDEMDESIRAHYGWPPAWHPGCQRPAPGWGES